MRPLKMNPVFCVPSYKRSDLIVKKTLATLSVHKIPASWIHIYVADEDEKRIYESAVPRVLYGEIHISAPGLAPSRNFILNSWPLGQLIVMMDDDVSDVMTRDASGGLVRADLLKVVIFGFQTCADVACCLWGIYPVCNGFFMNNVVTTDLRFCVGPLFGLINPGIGERGILLPMCEKEDYLRTLMAYDRDGAVVRLNNVAVKTTYYRTRGGLEAPDRVRRQEVAVNYALGRWPDRVAIDTRKKKTGYPEIKLKKVRKDHTDTRVAPDF